MTRREVSFAMLTEILCDKFVDSGKPRGPIRFHSGLNIVLGTKHGANSIGKSTFLLVVDYAFGGSTYADIEDIRRNVGDHEIKFTHEIDGVSHRFMRDVSNPRAVWRCADGYIPLEQISLEKFNSWMLEAYGMSALGGTFRGMIGPFLRAYGKQNLDEKRPLTAFPKENGGESIKRILQLYGKYGSIDAVGSRLKIAEGKSKSYAAVCKDSLVAVAANMTEYHNNEKAIEELREELTSLETSSQQGVLDMDPMVAERAAALRQQRNSLSRRRGSLISRKRRMSADLNLGAYRKAKDFTQLKQFFPDANLRKIEEIESFHESIMKVLKQEHRSVLEDLERQIELADSEIHRIDDEIESMKASPNVSVATLRSYAGVSRDLQKLVDANEAYDCKKELANEVKRLETEKRALSEDALLTIQMNINACLSRLNEVVCGPERTSPQLSFTGPRSYEYSIPNDTGTGSQVRGMLLLDYVLLAETPLPAIAEDTVSIKQVADDSILRFLELCTLLDKQVFIAIDKAESFDGNEGLPALIDENVVLRLSDGHELYGKQWGVRH